MGQSPRDHGFIARRLDRRVNDLWDLAADKPDLALARARSLQVWLIERPMTGDAERLQRVYLAQLSDLIHYLTA